MKRFFIVFLITFYAFHAAQAHDARFFSKTKPAFIENSGQWDADVLYYCSIPGFDAWITGKSLIMDFYTSSGEPNNISEPASTPFWRREGNVIKMNFENAESPSILPRNPLAAYYNYFIGNDRSKWANHVRLFPELLLKNIYQGMDLRLYFDRGFLRYDLIALPDADIRKIKLSFEGADDLFLNDKNELIIASSYGEVIHKMLYAYQIKGTDTIEIKCSFVRNHDNTVGFSLEDYDSSRALIIDPLIYSTYLGGSDYDYAQSIAIDTAGNAYVTGYTSSADFPSTPGAYSEEYRKNSFGYPDIFVSKINPECSELMYSTFIGGIVDDFARDIAIDASGNVFITGYTYKSKTFPVTENAYDTLHNGGYDVIMIKLNNAGSELLYSTFIGGEKDDYGQSIAIDGTGQAFVTGYTTETGNYPVTAGAFQETHHGGYDSFVSKLSADGDALLYSTFVGGAKDDFGQGIDIGGNGKAFVVGVTRSKDFPATPGAFDATYNDTSRTIHLNDAFVYVLNRDASGLSYSSYLGGKARDGGYDIALDNLNNFYITGFTESADFPVTPFAYDTTYNSEGTTKGAGDVFVTKFNSAGNTIDYSTFVGGISAERGFGIDVDEYFQCYVTGSTGSKDFPLSNSPYDPSYNDSLKSDAFLFKLTPDGHSLFYSTYLGGSDADLGNGVVSFGDGSVYICGSTFSADFPTGENAFDKEYNDSGKVDVFVARLFPSALFVYAGEDTTICSGSSATIGMPALGGIGSITYTWTPAEGLSAADVARPVASPLSSTTYTVHVIDEEGNEAFDEIYIEVLPSPEAFIYGARRVKVNKGNVYSSSIIENGIYRWSVVGGEIIAGEEDRIVEVFWTDTLNNGKLVLTVENEFGCIDTEEIVINISSSTFSPEIVPYGALTFCQGDSVILDAGGDYLFYLWSDAKRTRRDTVFVNGNYWVAVTDSSGLTRVSDTLRVTVNHNPPKPHIDTSNGMLICMEIVTFYQWFLNGAEIPGAVDRAYKPLEDGAYQVKVINDFGCWKISDIFYVGENSVHESMLGVGWRVYPNPNGGEFYFAADFAEPAPISITLINILGEEVYRFAGSIVSGFYIKRINAGKLSAGIYFLQVCSGRAFNVAKIIVN